jgi:Ataxin-2 C-terminal region
MAAVADQRDVKELVDLLSKLNPSAKEFVPSSKYSLAVSPPVSDYAWDQRLIGQLSPDAPIFIASPDYFGGFYQIITTGNYNKDSSSDGSNNGQPFPRVICFFNFFFNFVFYFVV